MPVLHQMQVSGNCHKVRLAARQLGVAITLKNYGLHDGSTRKPDYLAKNSNGSVVIRMACERQRRARRDADASREA
jgi:glutathione S-transferase